MQNVDLGRLILLPYLWSLTSLGSTQSLNDSTAACLMFVALAMLGSYIGVKIIYWKNKKPNKKYNKYHFLYILISNFAFLILTFFTTKDIFNYIILLAICTLVNLIYVYINKIQYK